MSGPSTGRGGTGAEVDGPGAQGLRLATGRGRWVLAAAVLGSSLAAIDSTVVGIALPAIGHDFTLPVSSLQWVVSAYLLALAGLLLVGGAAGDRFGRRRVFVVGVAWFALASLACAVAPDAPVLIAARAVQGVGGALLTPGSLAIMQASFAPEDRGRAVGAWSGFAGLGTAIGPFLGGFLISAVSWRAIFVINLPLAVVVIAVAIRHVPETRDPDAPRQLDPAGALLVTGGLGLLTGGLIEGPAHGWSSALVLGLLVGGACLLVAFVVAEAKERAPMLPLVLFRSRQFSATNAVTFVVYGALGGALFLVPVQLEQVSHYSPLEAGTSLLPLTALMLALSSRSGALAARIGPRLQMALGPVLVGVGMLLLRRAGANSDYVSAVLPGVTVLGIGLVVTVAPLTSTALSSAPVERAGIASAVNNDVARAGGLIAVALLPPIAGLTGSSYLHPLLFAEGFRRAVVIAAVASALGGVLAAILVRNPRPGQAGLRPLAARTPAPCCPLEATPLGHAPHGHPGPSTAVVAPGSRPGALR